MKKKFKVGDRVKAIKGVGYKDIKNVKGKVIGFVNKINVTVEFDEDIGGHNGELCGHKGKSGHCWHCKEENLKLIGSIDKLIFRDNTTILIKDGKRYIAKCCEGDTYDKEKGLLVCLAKAHGYTFDDLQKMLEDTEDQGGKASNAVKEVKRNAKVGEYIKIVKPEESHGAYKKGDILKVKENTFFEGDVLTECIKNKKGNTGKNHNYINKDEYIVLENYKPTKKFTDASKEVILQALKIINGTGIGFDTKDEVKEFYELVKGKFDIEWFDDNFCVGTKYLSHYGGCSWKNHFIRNYTYKQLKKTIKKLLKGQNNGY